MKIHIKKIAKTNKWVVLTCFMLLAFAIDTTEAQRGCTDPQAINYDKTAVENDGSCIYLETNYTPICLSVFEDELNECSGLQFLGHKLFAINDGGNGPQVFEIDSMNGQIKRSIWIDGTTNVDWEDLTADDDFLYIGDFGNNLGTRRNLKIIKVPKSELGSDTASAEEITFSYADQVDFTPQNRNNDYDCEAFFAYGDSLYLFSKNWVDEKTRLYVLPKSGDNISVNPIAEFDVNGQITAADISDDGKQILLLGYTEQGNTFMWLLFDYQDFSPFSGNKRKIKLGSVIVRAQIEALAFQSNDEGFIGGEDFSVIEGKFTHFKISQWINNPSSTNNFAAADLLHLYPNPFEEELLVDVKTDGLKIKKIELYNSLGKRVIRKRKNLKKRIRINGNKLESGLYVMRIFTKKSGVIVRKVVRL